MNIEQARFNMIEQQIRPWEVLDAQILNLLSVVKREDFVPLAHKALAFVDMEIPLQAQGTSGQVMLAPRVQARLLQDLHLQQQDSVLEIGTGSGYMAALLAHHARHVTTVDIEPELQALATRNLAAYGVTNVSVESGDGARGWTDKAALFDVIVLSGSLPVVHDAFLTQLKIGGRLFAVIGEAPIMTACLITRMSNDAWETEQLFETSIKALRNTAAPSGFHF